MERYVGRIWMAVLGVVLAIVVLVQGDSLTPIEIPEGATPFRTALVASPVGSPIRHCPVRRTLT